jgi:hypothetical protein
MTMDYLAIVVSTLAAIFVSYLLRKQKPKPKKAVSLVITFILPGVQKIIFGTYIERIDNMATLPVTGTAVAVLKSGLDASGAVVALPTFDAAPSWSIDAALGVLVASDDGLSCTLTPTGVLGSAVLTVTGVVGTKVLTGTANVDFVAGPAVALAIEITVS